MAPKSKTAAKAATRRRFLKLVTDVRKQLFPGLRVSLRFAATRRNFRSERAYAYYLISGRCIVLAPDFCDLPAASQEGLLRHELGHAVDRQAPHRELEACFTAPIAKTSERRADDIAEGIWGSRIRYDGRDLQTVAKSGKTLRPKRLGL